MCKLTPEQKARNSFKRRLETFVLDSKVNPEFLNTVVDTGMDQYDLTILDWHARKAEYEGMQKAKETIVSETLKFEEEKKKLEQKFAEQKRIEARQQSIKAEANRKADLKLADEKKRLADKKLTEKRVITAIPINSDKVKISKFRDKLVVSVNEKLADPQLTPKQIAFFKNQIVIFDRKCETPNDAQASLIVVGGSVNSYYKFIKEASATERDLLKAKIPELLKLKGQRTTRTAVLIERLSWLYFARFLAEGKVPSEALRLAVNKVIYEFTAI